MSAITLTLLLPGKSTAVQSWTFDSEPTIRIGRAADNNVVLYSAVVSRHHLDLVLENGVWKAVNLGANGTYIEGNPIEDLPLKDGVVLCLASSGPKIQINLGSGLISSKQGQEPDSEGDDSSHRHSGDSEDTVIN